MKHFLFSLLSLVLALSCLTPMQALSQTPHAQVILEPGTGGNVYQIKWEGVAGRVYSIQTSLDLQTWAYAPVIELGAGADIIWGFSPAGQRSYIRLKYSVATTYTQGGEGDIDGDGISNLDEVKFFGTDPFLSDDSDSDGYLNADETAAGSDPNNSTIKPFDPNNAPPTNRYVVPVSWWVENKFNDTVEAANALGLTAKLEAYASQATTLADGSYDLPFTSIQAAVTAANTGDVIQVAPGTYDETVDLSSKNVRLIAQRGSREETIIKAPTASAQAVLLGSGNTTGTTLSGFTIKNASGAAVKYQGGTGAWMHNLLIQGSKSGIVADGASPVVLNVVVDGCTGTASTDAALRITGTATVKAAHCTFTDNVPSNTADGQVQVIGAGASLTLVSSIVTNTGASSRAGGQIRLTSGGTATVTYSSIRTGFTGTGNITSGNPADPAAPYFDTDALTGGQRRLLRGCECVDRGNPAGILGFSYLTRLDSDGEARRRGYAVAVRASGADMGADEHVARLKFPTIDRRERGQVKTYSSVDEASDVAFLGQLGSGNAKIAIINDETIKDTLGTEYNDVTFWEISATTGDLVSGTTYATAARSIKQGTVETKDPEGLAYDSSTGNLYLTSSQTRVNHYRGSEPTTYDPLVDPPSNDYDPRRAVMVSIPVDATFSATGTNTFFDSDDGPWNTATPSARRDMDAFAAGISTTSPVGFNPTGLAATLRTQLSTNTALQASVKSTGVLLAISTSPKFGEPVNGTTYLPGAGLPYNQANGLGGPAATAGYVLHLPANTASADFPYYTLDTLPAVGQQITGYKTTVGGSVITLTANATYYFKAWPYNGSRVYGRGIEAQASLTNIPPVKINEINAVGTDWVEFFNPTGQAINIGGLVVMDEQDRSNDANRFIAANSIIQPRGFLTINFPFGLGAGSDNVRLFLPTSPNLTEVDIYQTYTRDILTNNTEGRAWDGGPRGKRFDFDSTRFEGEGGIFHTAAESPHPPTQNAANQTQTQSSAKYLQASHNHLTQSGVFLHYVNLGEELAVWRYSPKQQDFHPISVEGLAIKSQSEIVVGLRSPLNNRTTGNAYALVFSNASNAMLPSSGVWTAAAGGFQSLKQLDLNGQGIRSIQWCPAVKNAGGTNGAYLIVGGAANGGPLKNETGREKFSLYRWDSITATPVRVVADLSPYAVRPEGVNIITLNGEKRILFVEDRYKAQGYDTQNGVHWPISVLNLQ